MNTRKLPPEWIHGDANPTNATFFKTGEFKLHYQSTTGLVAEYQGYLESTPTFVLRKLYNYIGYLLHERYDKETLGPRPSKERGDCDEE